ANLVLVISRLGIGVRLSLPRNAIEGVEAGTCIKLPYISVILIRAGLSDEINDGTPGAAIFRRGRIGQGGHALEDIGDVDIKGLAAYADVVDVLAVHHEVVAARTRSIDLNLIEVAADTSEPEVLVHD